MVVFLRERLWLWPSTPIAHRGRVYARHRVPCDAVLSCMIVPVCSGTLLWVLSSSSISRFDDRMICSPSSPSSLKILCLGCRVALCSVFPAKVMFGAEISILCRIRKKGSVIIGEVLTTEVIHRVFCQGLYVYMYVAGKSSGRGTTVMDAPTRKRPSALFGLWCLTTVFASATADVETDGKCHRGQAHRARQEPDAQGLKREITVFPALARQSLSTSAPTTLMRTMASLWDLWSVATAERNKSHSLAPARPRKI